MYMKFFTIYLISIFINLSVFTNALYLHQNQLQKNTHKTPQNLKKQQINLSQNLYQPFIQLAKNPQGIRKMLENDLNFLPTLDIAQKQFIVNEALKTILSQNSSEAEERLFQKIFKDNLNISHNLLRAQGFQHFFNSNTGKKHQNTLKIPHHMLSHQNKLLILENAFRHGELGQIKFSHAFSKKQNLHQNVETFGQNHYITKSGYQTQLWQPQNWMSYLNKASGVNVFSIPGTHDSAADQSTSFAFNLVPGPWKTQNLTIQQQINIGNRYFDLRIECEQGELLQFFHGPVPVGSFEKFTEPVKKFLNKYPSEFFIVSVQKQKGEVDPETCGKMLFQELNRSMGNISRYCYSCRSNYIPTYGEVMGKMWLLQGGNQIKLPGELEIVTNTSDKVIQTAVYINQNYWKGPKNVKETKALDIMTNSKYSQKLRINYLSEQLNIKTQESAQDSSFIYNTWLMNKINQENLTNIGIVLTDFANQTVTSAIYKTNA